MKLVVQGLDIAARMAGLGSLGPAWRVSGHGYAPSACNDGSSIPFPRHQVLQEHLPFPGTSRDMSELCQAQQAKCWQNNEAYQRQELLFEMCVIGNSTANTQIKTASQMVVWRAAPGYSSSRAPSVYCMRAIWQAENMTAWFQRAEQRFQLL